MRNAAHQHLAWRLTAALLAAGAALALMGLLDMLFALLATVDPLALAYAPATVCDNPVSLGCLLSDGGAAGAGAAAAAAAARWDAQPGAAPHRAAETPAGYNPPARQTGYDAVNDPAFQAQQDQYTRDHPDTRPVVPQPGLADQAANNFWGSVRTSYGRGQ